MVVRRGFAFINWSQFILGRKNPVVLLDESATELTRPYPCPFLTGNLSDSQISKNRHVWNTPSARRTKSPVFKDMEGGKKTTRSAGKKKIHGVINEEHSCRLKRGSRKKCKCLQRSWNLPGDPHKPSLSLWVRSWSFPLKHWGCV